jgi:glutamate/tyrosine decarboxylase-like PLP-dependent enzyme
VDKKAGIDDAPARRSILTAWFLGPKAEHFDLWQSSFDYIFQDYANWRRNYFPKDPVVVTRERRRGQYEWIDKLNGALDVMLAALKAHYPFYSPRYIAHMLSEQSLPSVLGYFAGMLYNPNNVTDEAAPVTVELELAVGELVAEMLGYDKNKSWTHICSGGTVATLEALWVARTVQFLPLMVRQYCEDQRLAFQVTMPGATEARDIREIPNRDLLGLQPSQAAGLLKRLVDESSSPDTTPEDAKKRWNEIKTELLKSRFNVRDFGLAAVLGEVDRGVAVEAPRAAPRPVIFASAAAHYSLKKSANVLGYGEHAVELIPVDEKFRIDVDQLRDRIFALDEDCYVAAVIGIVGTTEEGAVDPVHEILKLREEVERAKKRSFWLHIDAAWGGYIKAVFQGLGLEPPSPHLSEFELLELCEKYREKMQVEEDLRKEVNWRPKPMRDATVSFGKELKPRIAWCDFDVYKAFFAIGSADSIVVDPHKMGYVPYPAGMVSFRDAQVTQLVELKADYISDDDDEVELAGEAQPEPGRVRRAIEHIGSHILEGSKPGAAATACWLAHSTIELTHSGHGKIVKTSLLNAQRLARYLGMHQAHFAAIDASVRGPAAKRPFTFHVICDPPDTNIVIFVARPLLWKSGKLEPARYTLKQLNELNRFIYHALSVKPKDPTRYPLVQDYFVQKTAFKKEQYNGRSLEKLLNAFGVSEDYEDERNDGLYVLRSTVMNPFYFSAREVQMDYLYGFVEYLHRQAREYFTDPKNWPTPEAG